jgi:hypothetical protein
MGAMKSRDQDYLRGQRPQITSHKSLDSRKLLYYRLSAKTGDAICLVANASTRYVSFGSL